MNREPKASIKWLAAALSVGGLLGAHAANAQSVTPPAATCQATNFNTWLAPSQPPTGPLSFVPPNSTTFPGPPSCNFYLWGAQMFLWLTSPDAKGNLNIFSPTFYTAIENANGGFEFVQNEGAGATGPLMAKSGQPVQFRVRVNKSKLPPLKVMKLLKLRAAGQSTANTPSTGQAGGGGVLVANGQPIPVPGNPQYATYPIVYYTIQANDVEAGLANSVIHQSTLPSYYQNGPNAGNFPITLSQAQDIQTVAGGKFSDLEQLALEVKSAWIDTAYLKNLPGAEQSNFITVQATVPAFQASQVNGLVVLTAPGNVTTTRTLALIGMHVVGSVAGHPELIWSTFESQYNSPDATYSYLNNNLVLTTNPPTCPSNNCITTVPLSTSVAIPTLFYNGSSTAAVAPSAITETATSSTLPNGNVAITFSSASYMSTSLNLAPTSVVRLDPWGNQQPATPTITDKTVINNTLLISLQASVGSQLTAQGRNGPILATYVQGGAIWTDGQVPFFPPPTPPTPPQPPQFGSLALANTTMETFQQSTPGSLTQAPAVQPVANCFGCHSASNPPPFSPSNPGATLSHIFP
jgi:hypothetical protein